MDSSSSKNIFIIPARSGSKGIKNKNIKLLNGVEMFAWSIIHAKYLSSKNDLIIVSSDSEKYLKIVEKGAVPYKRPKSLSGDKVFTEPVMEDVLKNFDTKLNDKVFLLQPTSPLRSKSTLNQVKKILTNGSKSLLTVKEAYQFEWREQNNLGKAQYSKRPRRQDMKPKYIENGSIYMNTVENFIRNNNRVAEKANLIICDEIESIEVDNKSELDLIKSLSITFNNQWKKERLGQKNISTLILDIDGVFASNDKSINKNERVYSTQDSHALSNFIKNGGNVFLVSSEVKSHSENLFKKIGVKHLKFNSRNKLEDIKKFLNYQKINKNQVCFVGNDIQDLDSIKYFNTSAVPNDANESIKPYAKIQLNSNGGQGVVVEVLELIK